MATSNEPTANKVSIELDSKTAHELKTITHNGLVAASAYVASAKLDASDSDLSPTPKTVKIDMDPDTALEISKKLNDGLKASGAYVG